MKENCGVSVSGVRHESGASGASGTCCVCLALEYPKDLELPVQVDIRHPSAPRGVPTHPSVFRRRTGQGAAILVVLGMSHDPEIGTPAVEWVSIDVVDFRWVANGEAEQFSVQEHGTTFPIADPFPPHNIAASRSVPPPLADISGIRDINQRVTVDFPTALMQGYQGGAFKIQTLDDAVRTNPRTSFRAESTAVPFHIICGALERYVAALASALHDILQRHRQITPVGVTPPDVDASRGLSHSSNSTKTNAYAA